MEAGAFGYIRGGSEDEWTMKKIRLLLIQKNHATDITRNRLSGFAYISFGIELEHRLSKAPSAAQGVGT